MEKDNYLEYSPHSELKKYISCYWVLNIGTDLCKNYTILPDSYFTFLIIMKKNKKNYIEITGLRKSAITVTPDPNCTIIGIRFKLVGIMTFFGIPIRNLLNSPFSIDQISENKLLNKINEILISNDIKTIITEIDKLLIISLRVIIKKDSRSKLYSILNQISIMKGNIKINDLSNDFYISSRNLRRLFKMYFNFGIKEYCQLVRLKALMEGISKLKDHNELVDVALSLGYFDQAHCIKELKRFTEFTPNKFLKMSLSGRFLQF